MARKKKTRMNANHRNNSDFLDSAMLNNATYSDYLNRLKRVATSIFEWVDLPESMDARYLEKSLYYYGTASLLYDKNYGYINTNCSSAGQLNIYGLPTELCCYSYEYNEYRKLYTGLDKGSEDDTECVLVMNNWDRIPTFSAMELFALRLYEAERTADTNIKAQKTPVMIVVNDTQKLMMKNLYEKYDGNQPFIFGDKNQLNAESLRAVKTDAPFIADKIMDYKKEIWNEALTYLRN